jgi:hypothetical protein
LMAGFTKKIPNNPLTQFNYSSLKWKSTPVASSYGISGGIVWWDQKEGLAFLQQLHSTTISSKSNGTAKASVNGNGIAQKF